MPCPVPHHNVPPWYLVDLFSSSRNHKGFNKWQRQEYAHSTTNLFTYCWWKKSCTWDVTNLVNNEINYQPQRLAGCLEPPKKRGQQIGPTGCKLSKMSGSKILRRAASNLKNISIFGSNFIGNFRVPPGDDPAVTFFINLWRGSCLHSPSQVTDLNAVTCYRSLVSFRMLGGFY